MPEAGSGGTVCERGREGPGVSVAEFCHLDKIVQTIPPVLELPDGMQVPRVPWTSCPAVQSAAFVLIHSQM